MREKIRVSKTGVTSSGRIALYTNSPEATDMDPSLVSYIQGNSLSPLYLGTADLDTEDISDDDAAIVESADASKSSEESEESSSSSRIKKIPSLSDISIVSNTVVFDSAGNPSVTLIFKVKNSSGETLKGMNARVELA
jgi:hypothetical protein